MKKLLLTIWVLLLPFQAISNGDAKKETLETILQKTAAYCKRLKTVAFRFVCYEKVVEIFDQETRYYSLVFHVSPRRKVIKNEYINDYGILKIGNQIKEHRKLIKHNGKNIYPKNKDLQSVIYSYKGALSPIYLFSMENQPKFIYNFLGEKKVLEDSGIIEKVIIELHQLGEIIANLGAFTPTYISSSNQPYKVKFNSIPYYKNIRCIEPCLNKGKPFVLILRNSKGKIKAIINVTLKIIDIPTIK